MAWLLLSEANFMYILSFFTSHKFGLVVPDVVSNIVPDTVFDMRLNNARQLHLFNCTLCPNGQMGHTKTYTNVAVAHSSTGFSSASLNQSL
jgi:hypothetical protein